MENVWMNYLKNGFEWIQWLVNKYLFHCWMNQCFWTNPLNERFNDKLANTFFNSQLSTPSGIRCNWYNCYLTCQVRNNSIVTTLSINFDRYRKHRCLNTNLKLISQYSCDNVNICNTEITNVWFKTALSGSGRTNTDLNVPVWFCQRFNRRGRIVAINKVGSRGCLNRDRDLFTINRVALAVIVF